MFNEKKGFTLIELAVVLVVISILTVGLLKASGIIATSRLANARSLTASSPVTKIDGLTAWYESSMSHSFEANERVEGGDITKWYDSNPESITESKNTLDINGSAGSSQVTYQSRGINDLPSVKFSGDTYAEFHLAQYFQGDLSKQTVFLVMSIDSSDNYRTFFDQDVGPNPSNIRLTDANNIAMNFGVHSEFSYSLVIAKPIIFVASINGSNSNMFINNASTGVDGVKNVGSNLIQGITLGGHSNNDPDSNLIGKISEVIIYNRHLKLSERKDVMRYLSKKYNIIVEGL